MNGETLEQVDSFKYMGARITEDGKSTIEIRARLEIALSAMLRLSKMWKSQRISIATKIRLYKASIALYGCEDLGYPTTKNGPKRTYIPFSPLPKIANC